MQNNAPSCDSWNLYRSMLASLWHHLTAGHSVGRSTKCSRLWVLPPARAKPNSIAVVADDPCLTFSIHVKHNDLLAPCQYNVTEWCIVLGALAMICQWGSTMSVLTLVPCPKNQTKWVHFVTASSNRRRGISEWDVRERCIHRLSYINLYIVCAFLLCRIFLKTNHRFPY